MMASRSTDFSASITLWVTRKTAQPHWPSSRIWSHSSLRRSGSTSLVGSSRITTRPGHTVTMENPTSRLIPPDRRWPMVLRPLADVERLDQLPGPAPHGGAVAAADPPGELDRLANPERVDGHRRLRQVGAELARRVRIGHQVEGTEPDQALVRLQQADNLFDQRCFPRSVRPEQAVDLPGRTLSVIESFARSALP